MQTENRNKSVFQPLDDDDQLGVRMTFCNTEDANNNKCYHLHG